LKGDCSSLQEIIDSRHQTLSVLKQLEDMGFVLKVLKQLRNTINEVASANKIQNDKALEKFLRDIEEQYDDKLGFEIKLEQLRSEIVSVTTSINVARSIMVNQPLIGPSLQRLFARGVQVHDIVDIANLFERSDQDADKQALLGGLKRYRTLSTIIEKLNQELERSKQKAIALGLDKQKLYQQEERMLTLLTHLKGTVDLLRNPDSLNYSGDKNENMKILVMISLVLQNLHVWKGEGEKLLEDDLEIDLPVGESTFKGLPELKIAVAKGLTMMKDKLAARQVKQPN
jgi:hypothetical protein